MCESLLSCVRSILHHKNCQFQQNKTGEINTDLPIKQSPMEKNFSIAVDHAIIRFFEEQTKDLTPRSQELVDRYVSTSNKYGYVLALRTKFVFTMDNLERADQSRAFMKIFLKEISNNGTLDQCGYVIWFWNRCFLTAIMEFARKIHANDSICFKLNEFMSYTQSILLKMT